MEYTCYYGFALAEGFEYVSTKSVRATNGSKSFRGKGLLFDVWNLKAESWARTMRVFAT